MSQLLIIVFIVVLFVALAVVLFLMKKNQAGGLSSTKHKSKSIKNEAPSFSRFGDSKKLAKNTGTPIPSSIEDNINDDSPDSVQNDLAQNTLKLAQGFIDQQRYDYAEAELVKGMKTTPNNNEIPLKLLNLYAITNNTPSFQDIFAKILDKGDVPTIQEAEQIKSLLEAEQISQNIQPISDESKQESIADKGIDFDTNFDSDEELSLENLEDSLVNNPQDIPTKSESELSLDLSLTEDKRNDIQPTFSPDSSISQPDTSDDNNAFANLSLETDESTVDTKSNELIEFSFDDLSIESSSLDEENVQNAEEDLSFDDFNIESPTPLSTGSETSSSNSATELDNELSLTSDVSNDLNIDLVDLDLSIDEPIKEKISDNQLAIDHEIEGVDVSFEELSIDTSDSQVTSPAITELNTIEETITNSQQINSSDLANTEPDLPDFGDIDLSIDTPSSDEDKLTSQDLASAPTPTTDAVIDDEANLASSFEDIDLSLEEDIFEHLETPTDTTQSSENPEQFNDTYAQLDALNAPNNDFDLAGSAPSLVESEQSSSTTDEPVLDEPVSNITTDSDDLDHSVELSLDDLDSILDDDIIDSESNSTIDSVSIEKPVTQALTPEISIPTDLSEDFAIVDSLDNNQITLDLAQQYLSLGEYDSAKRLLQEVIDAGTAEQIDQAQRVLAQAG